MKKIILLITITLITINLCNAQKWFEGEAKYKFQISVKDVPVDKIEFEYNEYYKDGNVRTRIYNEYTGEYIIIFDNKKQTIYSEQSKEKSVKISNMKPIKVIEIDRNITELNGYKCIKVVTIKDDEGTEKTYTEWVDESYSITYKEGQIKEVPKGLVVKSTISANKSKLDISYTRELKSISKKEISDSEFKQ
ncbi:MAG: hypothetical protein IKY43_01105 [Bacteroidales bacterium]|nr:hypothetical protein [Bacteroidales bacterium]